MAPATEQQHSQYHEGPKIETQKRLSVLGKENIGKVLLFISCPPSPIADHPSALPFPTTSSFSSQ